MKARFQSIQGNALSAVMGLAMVCMIGLLMVTSFAPGLLRSAQAATQNYPVGTAVYALPLQLAGTYDASLSKVASIKLPYAARLIGFTATARGYSGTGATQTLDLRANGASLLTAPLGISTVTAEASIATAAIPDESVITVDYALGASGVNNTDMTLLMTFVR